ncbi:MAG: hypothetical protein A2782_01810 [Candidatus Blackburnbacteria bacterium RIFCSPHIGHO2_01_FULL_43_15b]|uniref:DUF192 domain-containing protein n=1 Tax=Candidatus Blackburnbacteria bacterium RIFCSPHIGHO2_01_FULL_43_15b TaxID=1797513 RepID=A0A1G1V1N0_9BACT|nr:MAG: hypothetical protein A2782_01810 [Candidatus Blackburnbacteria bacterium RIFCSPHIGHO2_01_FULL_43_15b]
MKQILILFAILIGVLLLAYWSSKPGNLEGFFVKTGIPIANSGNANQEKKFVTVGSTQFQVELAQNEQARKVGLSTRDALPENEGMLFTFGKNGFQPTFWMKGMKFPIDIIWIKDSVVSEITPDVPTVASGIPDNEIPQYSPKSKVDYVLEIPANVAQKRGIKVGDSAVLPL